MLVSPDGWQPLLGRPGDNRGPLADSDRATEYNQSVGTSALDLDEHFPDIVRTLNLERQDAYAETA